MYVHITRSLDVHCNRRRWMTYQDDAPIMFYETAVIQMSKRTFQTKIANLHPPLMGLLCLMCRLQAMESYTTFRNHISGTFMFKCRIIDAKTCTSSWTHARNGSTHSQPGQISALIEYMLSLFYAWISPTPPPPILKNTHIIWPHQEHVDFNKLSRIDLLCFRWLLYNSHTRLPHICIKIFADLRRNRFVASASYPRAAPLVAPGEGVPQERAEEVIRDDGRALLQPHAVRFLAANNRG